MDKIKHELEVLKNNLKWKLQIDTRPKQDGWMETTLDDLVDSILIITGHLEDTEIVYPETSETTGTNIGINGAELIPKVSWTKLKVKHEDWIDSERSKATEDENSLRQEAEENK